MITVFELIIKIYLIKDVKQKEIHNIIAEFIDSFLLEKEKFAEFHEKNVYKFYSFDEPFPIAQNGIYKGDFQYQFRLRTVDAELADYFAGGLADHQTKAVKGLMRTVRVIPNRQIAKIYTVTPIIIKTPDKKGYWKDCMPFARLENAIRNNLIKKYNSFTGEKLQEDFGLYDQIELLNKSPIGIPYKGITLLGDKVSFIAADNEIAQKLWYFALGTGLCEMNSRGQGFLQYHFL